ncbi:response regulator receiver-modulated signal transduction diguanylate cyclase [Oleiphilus messinensis]|uniref:diguanylate cyclase n=1 Tax=Oleiphilus messinensis TaxID=141451 RepID=A0A1Y0I4T2_9GAMM|nr:diguanylate cyclase [Oleiphilus messinensis]ARU55219.1 response regulator receiver-modulated signal transduction diguanylate cyclase [Oleiphilus messinensis]
MIDLFQCSPETGRSLSVVTERPDFPVLLVDDDVVFRELALLFLQEEGYVVEAVADAYEAQIRIQERHYPLILCDWMMPEMNGLELCSRLRRCSEPYHYIILLTSKNDEDEIVTGLNAGADDYIVKGGRKSELLARLDCGVRILIQQRLLEQQKQEILQQAQRDPLTGAYNRGYLTQTLVCELKRAQRYQLPTSVLLADIDFFKSVNDRYGHLGGDEALKAFLQVLLQNIRVNIDWVCRYGGEEFVIVLPNTEHKQALLVAEKLRAAVRAMTIQFENTTIQLTASFGLATYPDDLTCNKSDDVSCDQSDLDESPLDNLLKLADDRLYRSKQNGRNKVTGR